MHFALCTVHHIIACCSLDCIIAFCMCITWLSSLSILLLLCILSFSSYFLCPCAPFPGPLVLPAPQPDSWADMEGSRAGVRGELFETAQRACCPSEFAIHVLQRYCNSLPGSSRCVHECSNPPGHSRLHAISLRCYCCSLSRSLHVTSLQHSAMLHHVTSLQHSAMLHEHCLVASSSLTPNVCTERLSRMQSGEHAQCAHFM
jgi:hypothetical protein